MPVELLQKFDQIFHFSDIFDPARLTARLLFGLVSDSVFAKLNQNFNKYWDGKIHANLSYYL